jgi:hypothetical protein
LSSTRSRLTVEAISGARSARASVFAMASAPGSYPRWLSSNRWEERKNTR